MPLDVSECVVLSGAGQIAFLCRAHIGSHIPHPLHQLWIHKVVLERLPGILCESSEELSVGEKGFSISAIVGRR
jgi:hypothetical protein